MLKGKVKLPILIAVIIAILVLSLLYINQNDSETYSKIIYEFTLNVSENNGTSTFMLPVPMSEGQLINFNYTVMSLVNCTADLAVVNTSYGLALKIITNGTNEIRFWSEISMPYDEYLNSKLSMYDSTQMNNVEYYCWVYYNGPSSANITLKFHEKLAEHGHIIGKSRISDTPPLELIVGWQKAIVDNRFPTP